MSLVVFPFKTEDPRVVVGNVRIAASHPAVEQVVCVGVEQEETYRALAGWQQEVVAETGTRVELILQDRLGNRRPGKGDGMNTALRYFAEHSEADRLHFYDADITSFGAHWITQAEDAADLGYEVVRHYFPRSSTDAMITWMITRTGFALLWPGSELPWIEQPLGGELLFSRRVVDALLADERVQAQSDWGIDTLYTFSTVQHGFTLYETYVAGGKAHALYGALTDLRSMVVECFAAIQGLAGEEVSGSSVHRIEPPDIVPREITETIGFDFEGTLALTASGWTPRQVELLDRFPAPVRDGMLANRSHPRFAFMDEEAWRLVYLLLLEHFRKGDPDWEELLFKLWTVRVLNYTTTAALRGYGYARRYLRAMIGRYLRGAALGS